MSIPIHLAKWYVLTHTETWRSPWLCFFRRHASLPPRCHGAIWPAAAAANVHPFRGRTARPDAAANATNATTDSRPGFNDVPFDSVGNSLGQLRLFDKGKKWNLKRLPRLVVGHAIGCLPKIQQELDVPNFPTQPIKWYPYDIHMISHKYLIKSTLFLMMTTNPCEVTAHLPVASRLREHSTPSTGHPMYRRHRTPPFGNQGWCRPQEVSWLKNVRKVVVFLRVNCWMFHKKKLIN